MIALLALVALFLFKKTFLYDPRRDDSTQRTDRNRCIGYDFIELNELENSMVESLF